jgi:hypothetical protein
MGLNIDTIVLDTCAVCTHLIGERLAYDWPLRQQA